VVLGFNVKSSPSAERLADDLEVGMRVFTIIYELLENAEGLLRGVGELEKAKIKGEGEVIKLFTLHSGDVVLGVSVAAGKIKYRDRIKVMRDEEEVHHGRVRGLKVGKNEVPEVKEGDQVGVLVKPQFDFKKGDKISVV
jgi:translation initiation factor IF-2